MCIAKTLALEKTFYRNGEIMRLYICAILLALPILIFGNPISLISESSDALTLKFILPDYELEETKIENEKYHQIIMDDIFHSQSWFLLIHNP